MSLGLTASLFRRCVLSSFQKPYFLTSNFTQAHVVVSSQPSTTNSASRSFASTPICCSSSSNEVVKVGDGESMLRMKGKEVFLLGKGC